MAFPGLTCRRNLFIRVLVQAVSFDPGIPHLPKNRDLTADKPGSTTPFRDDTMRS